MLRYKFVYMHTFNRDSLCTEGIMPVYPQIKSHSMRKSLEKVSVSQHLLE